MSITSDVAMVFTKELFEELKKEDKFTQLIEKADDEIEGVEQILLVFGFVEFYYENEDNIFYKLFNFLKGKEDSYYIYEVIPDYHVTEEFGSLVQEFNVGYTFSLTY